MKLVFLVFIFVALHALVCEKYAQEPGTVKENGVCATETETSFVGVTTNTLKKCEDNMYCQYNLTEKNGKCSRHLDHFKYPGEHCDRMEECVNSICTMSHTCHGKGEHENCNHNLDCYGGLYCSSNKVCEKLAERNKKCGACIPPYTCEKDETDSVCKRVKTLEIGAKATNWLACKSLNINESDSLCLQEEFSIDKNHTEPYEGEICFYYYTKDNENTTYNISAKCGNGNKTFCNVPRHQMKYDSLNKYIEFLEGHPEIARNAHPDCGLLCQLLDQNHEKYTLYLRAVIDYFKLKDSASILTIPEAVKKYTKNKPLYWNAVDRLDASNISYGFQQRVFLAATGISLGLITLLSIILGIKRCISYKPDDILNDGE